MHTFLNAGKRRNREITHICELSDKTRDMLVNVCKDKCKYMCIKMFSFLSKYLQYMSIVGKLHEVMNYHTHQSHKFIEILDNFPKHLWRCF